VDPLFQLWFAVRYTHLASVALLIGGAMLLCGLPIATRGRDDSGAALAAAGVYEWMFWTIAGITIVTGVSNLGLKGDGLLGPHTQWGGALTVKLTLVLAMLALSLARTDFVARCASRTSRVLPRRASAVLASLYGATAVGLLGALWLGLGLAHGRY
jgi:putative copper export protein